MPDYAGAVAAIQQRLADNWTTTPIALPNVTVEAYPPIDGNGNPGPWVYLEVIGSTSNIRAMGVPGDQFWLYQGLISAHVFVPVDYGNVDAFAWAVQIGEFYRNKSFYNSVDGYQVRTLSPRVDGGGAGSDDGKWFRVTATIPFEYYHRG